MLIHEAPEVQRIQIMMTFQATVMNLNLILEDMENLALGSHLKYTHIILFLPMEEHLF